MVDPKPQARRLKPCGTFSVPNDDECRIEVCSVEDLSRAPVADLEFRVVGDDGVERWVDAETMLKLFDVEDVLQVDDVLLKDAIALLKRATRAARRASINKVILVGSDMRMLAGAWLEFEPLFAANEHPVVRRQPLHLPETLRQACAVPRGPRLTRQPCVSKRAHGFFSASKTNLRNAP